MSEQMMQDYICSLLELNLPIPYILLQVLYKIGNNGPVTQQDSRRSGLIIYQELQLEELES